MSDAHEILSALKHCQNILLVGRRDAGKTHFVTHTLMPFLEREGMDVRYYKDMDEQMHSLSEDAVVIFDEFEMLDDRESLVCMHPEEQPYYSDSYLRRVHAWLQKAEHISNLRIFVLSRNEEDIEHVMNMTSFNFAPNVMVIEVAPWKAA